MTEQEINNKSIYDLFASQQETYDEAQKKNSEESRKRASYLRFSQDGTYSIRVLPLAPVIGADGSIASIGRKGYEYPLRSLLLKIESVSANGEKPKVQYVSVCNAKQVFGELKDDLIDTYLRIACDKYSSNDALIKKLKAGEFEGGLKWSSQRCMYVYNTEKKGDGIQILQLSYAQYKELEERKLSVWNKLLKKNPKAGCPISSLVGAYPVEVTRKTEAKTSYTFNIDTLSETNDLQEDELKQLLDLPRIPEVIYRYERYHLEASIAYLNQLDRKFGINIMDEPEISECISTIKMFIPSDDTSHFSIGGSVSESDDKKEEDASSAFAKIMDRFPYDKYEDMRDDSEDGYELRAELKEFIEDYDIDVSVVRGKRNMDIMKEVERKLNGEKSEPIGQDAQSIDGEDEMERPSSNLSERNDDTNEPAVRPIREHRRR